jgi:hypothetical protein
MSSKMEIKETDDGIIINSDWCYYIVAYLDVLGQKAVFNRLCPIKSGNEIDDRLKQEISENLYYLKTLRDTLNSYFIGYTSDEPSNVNINPAFQNQFNQMRKSEIFFQYFSDSVIAFVPLKFKTFYSVVVNGVWGVMAGCCMAMLGSLSTEHAIRGGIEISWGTRLESGEIYGPALNKAYSLESKIAKNPKIIIGDGVWNFLRSVSDKVRQHPKQIPKDIDYCQIIANRCLNLVLDDIDGCRILDYLGPGFLELQKNSPEFYQLYEESKQFVVNSFKKYSEEGNSKLAEKYRYLVDFFQSRSPFIEKA